MYCSLEDIQKRLSAETLLKLADIDGDGQPDSDVINAAISDADAEIDAYLGNRYKVPLSSPPALIRAMSTVLAIDALFARIPGLVSKEHRDRAEEVRHLLRYLAESDIDLSQAPEIILRSFVASTTSDIPRIFSRETLTNF
ncbi:DUF1320 domain-containing protein [Candidatus Sumerlaeota bacterium]|nr:DUF1320 domain-containing protein [Candidatus Sumerlaeota bacterium]